MARDRFDPSRYDVAAPWWFRNTFFLVLPFAIVMSIAGAQRSLPLFLAVLVLLVGLGAVVLAWERRHRIR